MVTIEFRGVNRVQNKLRRLASQMPQVVDKAMGPWAKDARAKLKSTPYPPKRPGQRYIRTGNLANRWGAGRIQPGQWAIRNTAPYAVYVVGNSRGGGQAWMHVGRWWIARNELNELTVTLVRDLTKAIEREWETG